jgi:hypothetical protein
VQPRLEIEKGALKNLADKGITNIACDVKAVRKCVPPQSDDRVTSRSQTRGDTIRAIQA